MLSEPNISYKPFWGICRPLNSWRANSPNPIQIYCAVISREVPNAISRKAYAFYDQVRSHQQEWQARANAGEDIDEIVDEAMNILKSLS